MTRSASWKVDNIFRSINNAFKEGQWDEWSVKDSFQTLDLVPFGFSKLFDARWFYLESSSFSPSPSSHTAVFKKVKNEQQLEQWICDWGEGLDTGKKIFNSRLLDDQTVDFVTCYHGEEPVRVALLNRTEDVIGISNFFVKESAAPMWSDLLLFIQKSYGNIDVVGYERNETIAELFMLGIRPVGDLTVWLKKSGSFT